MINVNLLLKQKNVLKGVSVYHMIEQKLINKLNYVHIKNQSMKELPYDPLLQQRAQVNPSSLF